MLDLRKLSNVLVGRHTLGISPNGSYPMGNCPVGVILIQQKTDEQKIKD